MRHKILWASSIDPHDQVRPNASSLTYLETVSTFGNTNPEISRATNYKEFIDALKINQEQFFSEICIDYHIDEKHTGTQCMQFLRAFCIACNLKMPRITPINATSDERVEMLAVVEEAYKHIIDSEEYV